MRRGWSVFGDGAESHKGSRDNADEARDGTRRSAEVTPGSTRAARALDPEDILKLGTTRRSHGDRGENADWRGRMRSALLEARMGRLWVAKGEEGRIPLGREGGVTHRCISCICKVEGLHISFIFKAGNVGNVGRTWGGHHVSELYK
jgi:hypothetical protein